MRIVVLVKAVPDTYGARDLSPETGLTHRTAQDAVVDEISERALEVALAYADAHPDTEVVALAMGPETARTGLRKALATGATSAALVLDDTLVGADVVLTAQVLAAAARHAGFDLVVAGDSSTDGGAGMVPAALAEALGVPCATALREVELDETEVRGVRVSDGATLRLTAPLPAVVSVTEALPAARLPGFKGIVAAKKKTIDTWTPADLGVDPLDPDTARSIMIAVAARPPRTGGTTITDEDGDAGQRLADYLLDNRLV